MSVLDESLAYLARGWFVVPVKFREKRPYLKGWPQLRLTAETAPNFFGSLEESVGLILGEPSGWLVDIDIDHPRAAELAPKYLPPTPAIYGRPGKPRSHWLYRVTGPIATRKINSKSAGMLIELKSTGQQSVAPPSIHTSGEPITWEVEGAEPAVVDPKVLLEAVNTIGNQVRVELGERSATRPRPKKADKPADEPPTPLSREERSVRALRSVLWMRTPDHNDGSLRLFAATCRAVEHDLDDSEAIKLIREYTRRRPFPKDWSEDDIRRRLRDAEKKCERGAAFATEADGTIPLGNIDPESSKLVLSPKRTLPTAEAFLREYHNHPDSLTLISYAGLLLRWSENRYVEVEDEAVRKQLQEWLHGSLRYVFNKSTKGLELVPFESNPATVNSALATIRSRVHLPASVCSPSWLHACSNNPPPFEILPCKTQLLHLPTQKILTPSPAFFSLNALEFDPVPEAPRPAAWLSFLHQLFDGDVEAFDLIQEWFGYCLTGDTSQQKMLFIVGPKRSGKGTIARVLAKLVGAGNVCGPTTSSLAGAFGLQPLIGKSLAIVSDARFSGESIATVVERLLCISGEDALTVDRKYLESITMKLGTRFMFLSNELPRLNDASGALAGRFLILRLTESFYGKEDMELTDKLLIELPGILNWAIEGWHRLREKGRFHMPPTGAEAMIDLEELSSPVSAFVRSECVLGENQRVWLDALYREWTLWCSREGRTFAGTRQSFGRDLTAAFPSVHCRRGSSQRFYEGIGLKQVAL